MVLAVGPGRVLDTGHRVDLVFNEEARAQLKAGIDALADAVKVTLAPRGRNIAVDKKWGRRPSPRLLVAT